MAKLSQEDLERIVGAFERKGTINLGEIVAAAKAKNHPLHDQFEWDDKKAAHQYRLQQAATIVRRIVSTTPIAPDVVRIVRTYISRPEDRLHDPHLYTRREIVLSDERDRLDHLIDGLQRALGVLSNLGARELEPLVTMTQNQLRRLQLERDGLAEAA